MALVEGAKQAGARVWTGARVTGLNVDRGRVTGVRFDDRDPVQAESVVNAAGMYANQVGALAGVEVPVVPFATSICSPSRSRAFARTCLRSATPTGSCTSAPRLGAAWWPAATSAIPLPGSGRRARLGFQP